MNVQHSLGHLAGFQRGRFAEEAKRGSRRGRDERKGEESSGITVNKFTQFIVKFQKSCFCFNDGK